jgi:hypothetical protein
MASRIATNDKPSADLAMRSNIVASVCATRPRRFGPARGVSKHTIACQKPEVCWLTQILTQTRVIFAHFRRPLLSRENRCLAAYSGNQRKPARVLDLTGGSSGRRFESCQGHRLVACSGGVFEGRREALHPTYISSFLFAGLYHRSEPVGFCLLGVSPRVTPSPRLSYLYRPRRNGADMKELGRSV